MSATIKFIATIVVLAIIVYLAVHYIYGKASLQDIAPDKFPLSDGKVVYMSDDTQTNLLTKSGSTIMAFVNVNFGERTASTTGDYQSIIGVNGAFSLDISPTSSQLSVNTSHVDPTSNTRATVTDSTETTQIPPLPLQKWVLVSILRDGRRFDVMYDDQIVASHRFEHFPKALPSPLIIGNPKLLGTAIHVLVAPYRLTPIQVSQQRAKLADMNGKPIGTDTSFGLPPIPFLGIRSMCFPGFSCDAVSAPPSNRLKSWSTPFS